MHELTCCNRLREAKHVKRRRRYCNLHGGHQRGGTILHLARGPSDSKGMERSRQARTEDGVPRAYQRSLDRHEASQFAAADAVHILASEGSPASLQQGQRSHMHASSPAPFESSRERQPRTIADILSERAILRPNAVAYRFLGESERNEVVITYAAMAQRARAVGAWLVAAGCADRSVLLLFSAGIDFPVAFFGTLYAGAIAVPAVPPRMSETGSRLDGIVADAEAALILTTRELAPRIAKAADRSPGMRWPRIATIEAIIANDADCWSPPVRQPGTPAVLQYTSGSTSSPKGVQVSDANVLHNLSLIARATSTTSASIGVSWLPHYHDMGLIGGLLLPIHSGFPVT